MIEKTIHKYGLLDSGSLCKLYRSPDVYIPSADDFTKPGDLQRFVDICLRTESFHVLGRDARYEAFIFTPCHNATTYMAHFAVRRDKRDGSVTRNVALAGKWMFENTTCESVVAFIREDNQAARATLAQVGMKKVGKIRKSVKFGGEYRDELIYQGNTDDYNAIWSDELGRV